MNRRIDLAIGDRVELRDPPHDTLHGEIVAMDQHAIRVRWDHMWDHHEPAIVGHGSTTLHHEGAPQHW